MAGVTLMKQGTNAEMPVQFTGLDLDDVMTIYFLFQQGTTTRRVVYPSAEAYRVSGSSDTVMVRWSEENTWQFVRQQDIQMDTKVYLTGTSLNPYTPIVSFRIGRTLFPQTEEG